MSDVVSATLSRLSRVPGVRSALIVDAEAGVPVASELGEGTSGEAVAALTASLFQRTERAARDAALGELGLLQLETDEGYVVVAGGRPLLVVVIADRDAQLGLIRLETDRAVEALR
ncbi:MAG: roadblock/LC7 domain-containing protein [bacterium]|jgi:predicted regulator of Ras-like GTPase activity (Roadblock/LC7/MglB family)|nr:MAG: hypothetical protein DIU52_09460 [bacterium]